MNTPTNPLTGWETLLLLEATAVALAVSLPTVIKMVTKTDPKGMAASEKPGVLPPRPPQKDQNSYERYGLGIDNDADRR